MPPSRLTVLAAVAAGAALALPAWAALPTPDPAHVAAARAAAVTPAAPASVAAAEQPDPAAAIAGRVQAALASAHAATAAAAVDVDGLGEVLRQEAAHQLPPASTQKTFTGLAALLAVGPSTRFRTEVATRGAVTAGRLPGSIWLVGGGDPYLTRSGLRSLARSVRASGVRYVAADLLLDDSRYDAQRHPTGWKSAFFPEEAGPLAALAADENSWRTDSAYLADPALPTARLFRDYLKAEGVTVHGTVRRARRATDAHTLVARDSGPLTAVVRRTMKESDNFAAEMLLKELGRVVKGQGTSAAGRAAIAEVLAGHQVRTGPGTDGSGLSRDDRQAAADQVALLHAADASTVGEAFRASLPIACRDGTLEKRMCGTAGEGRVAAKTGTLDGIRTLAGYTSTASGRAVWFSFVLTGIHDGTSARAALDRAAVVLASAQE